MDVKTSPDGITVQFEKNLPMWNFMIISGLSTCRIFLHNVSMNAVTIEIVKKTNIRGETNRWMNFILFIFDWFKKKSVKFHEISRKRMKLFCSINILKSHQSIRKK
jgi:hypothetical protein